MAGAGARAVTWNRLRVHSKKAGSGSATAENSFLVFICKRGEVGNLAVITEHCNILVFVFTITIDDVTPAADDVICLQRLNDEYPHCKFSFLFH